MLTTSRCRVVAVLVLAVAFLAAPIVSAQARLTGADIEGVVADASGAVLPGATVAATNAATNTVRSAVTDEKGRYYIAALPPGEYSVTAELSGFAPQSQKGVVLLLGQSVGIDFSLGVAGTHEEITVSAEAPVVDTHDTTVSTVVGQQQIDALPINGRNFISFSVITPGVTTDRTPQQGASATSGLSFTGQRARSNNIMVDGLDNNDATVGSVRATFSQEAIREFQVITNSYSAEFGKASGGVVNIITKSGTNEFSGNVFFFFRDESLNSKDHFEKFDVRGNRVDRPKAPYDQKQFGGTLGGPLKKDKTFFFLSFERLDITANNFVNIDPAAAQVLNSLGFPVELGNVPYAFESTEFLAKVNHEWAPNHSLILRANWSDTTNENIEPFGGITARSRGAVQLREDWAVAVSQTDILSQRWVNEVRVQFARQDQQVNALDPACGASCISESAGGPTVEVTGVANVGRHRFTPQPRKNDRIQITDTLSWFAGSHLLKAGIDFNYIDNKTQSLPLHFGGRYIFLGLPAIPGLLPAPITPLQALQLGLPAVYVQGYGSSLAPYKYKDLSVFVQDEWRVTSRLTLKPGLRYQKQFWPTVQYDVSNLNGTRFAYEFPQDGNNFGPRLAVAYDVTGDGKTAAHAAYGIFYDNHITGIVGITDGLDGGPNGVRTLVQRFPAAITAWRSPGRRIPEPTTPYPSLTISVDPALETPYAHQAAVGLDRAVSNDVSVSANFIYVRGKNQLGTIDYNPLLPALGAGRRPNDVNGVPGTSAAALQYTSFAETWYKGLTLSLTKRFTNNYQFLAAYTLSKAEDNSTDFQGAFIPQDNGRGRNPADPTGLPVGFDASLERGPATHDQRHRFVLSGLYQFPWDVQFSAIFTAASGRPFTPLAGADLNGDGDGGAFPSDRARRNPADPTSSVGRNSETMEKQINLDVRLSKRVRLGQRTSVDAIFEIFNVFDRANFSEINAVFGRGAFPAAPENPLYGLYEQALPPRQVQLALKLSF